jgi:hypothetical protein
MVNAFKAENKKEKSNIFNDKKRKANEDYAIDDDILFDAFSQILMTMSATKMKHMRIPMKRKSAVAYSVLNQTH